jgi:hypothetical protein
LLDTELPGNVFLPPCLCFTGAATLQIKLHEEKKKKKIKKKKKKKKKIKKKKKKIK